MNSSRLRAAQVEEFEQQMPTTTIDKAPENVVLSTLSSPVPADAIQQRVMQQTPTPLPVLKKAPYNYVKNEKCLAKWNDSRRWKATVQTVLDLGKYCVISSIRI